MVVYNETTLSGEDVTNLLVESVARDYKKRYLFIALIFIIGIAVLIYSIISKQNEFIVMGAVVSALAIAFFIYSIIDIKKSRKRVMKNNPEICELGAKYTFRFKENSVQIQAQIGTKNKKIEYSYQYLKSIKEDDQKYELVFNETDTIYVFKSGFENQKMEEFFRKNITTTKKKIKYRGEKK